MSIIYELLIFPGLVFLLFAFFLINWIERKLSAKIHNRVGPKFAGPEGLFQAVADLIKLFGKKPIVPKHANKLLFITLPFVLFFLGLIFILLIPFGTNSFAMIDLSLLVIFAIISTETLIYFLIGFYSRCRYGILGAERNVLQMLAYEIILSFSFIPIIMITHSLSLAKIIEMKIPLILQCPLSFLLLTIAFMMATDIKPFDIPKAESEIVYGAITEYSGIFYAFLSFSAFVFRFAFIGLIVSLFFNGFYPNTFIFIATIIIFRVFFVFVENSLPRTTIDSLIKFSWKYAFPLSIVNIFLTIMFIA